jgi:hypothetical protein
MGVALASATDATTSVAHFLTRCRRSSSLSEDEELLLEDASVCMAGLIGTARVKITTDHDGENC